MAISNKEKLAYVLKYAPKSDEKIQKIIRLAATMDNPKSKLTPEQKDKVKEGLSKLYSRFQEINEQKKGQTKSVTKKEPYFKKALQEFKQKVGKIEYKRATSKTDIKKDIERPALKAGKRFPKEGKTTNQYGTFKNNPKKPYWENRANRMDVNQPSKSKYPKLSEGGAVNEFKVGDDVVFEFNFSDTGTNLKQRAKIVGFENNYALVEYSRYDQSSNKNRKLKSRVEKSRLKKLSNGGYTKRVPDDKEKFYLSFNYNPSNLSNADAEKIVSKYTKDWKRDNDFDEVSFFVMNLTSSKANELKSELKMEDVYNIEITKSRYAQGGAVNDFKVGDNVVYEFNFSDTGTNSKQRAKIIGFENNYAIVEYSRYDQSSNKNRKLKSRVEKSRLKKLSEGGGFDMLKEDDNVWNALGKKLIVDKVTKDEYFLVAFGQPSASPFSKSKVHSYLKSGQWSLKPSINQEKTLSEIYEMLLAADKARTKQEVEEILEAMVKAGISDNDLIAPKTKTGRNLSSNTFSKFKDKKTEELQKKMYAKYEGKLSGNQPFSVIYKMIGMANEEPSIHTIKTFENKNVVESDELGSAEVKRAQGGVFEHGLSKGDKIVEVVDDKYLVIESKDGVMSVINIEKGGRFILGLDDSKDSGSRKDVGKVGLDEAMQYINYVKNQKMSNGGEIVVSDIEKKKSLKGNAKLKF